MVEESQATETTNGSLNRKLRMALTGGGLGAFIGRVHATAAVLDNRAELVAGAFSSSAEKSRASAPAYDVCLERAYGSIQELVEKELALPADQRIDFVINGVELPGMHAVFRHDTSSALPYPLESHLWLFAVGDWYLKFRVTSPQEETPTSLEAQKRFIASFEWQQPP